MQSLLKSTNHCILIPKNSYVFEEMDVMEMNADNDATVLTLPATVVSNSSLTQAQIESFAFIDQNLPSLSSTPVSITQELAVPPLISTSTEHGRPSKQHPPLLQH
ncbi:hypothetical protein ACFX16_023076 [Malus domestica]